MTPSAEFEREELEAALDESCAELANDELGIVVIVAQRLARIESRRTNDESPGIALGASRGAGFGGPPYPLRPGNDLG